MTRHWVGLVGQQFVGGRRILGQWMPWLRSDWPRVTNLAGAMALSSPTLITMGSHGESEIACRPLSELGIAAASGWYPDPRVPGGPCDRRPAA